MDIIQEFVLSDLPPLNISGMLQEMSSKGGVVVRVWWG
jgi:hypothetical protein